ncbi:elongation factor G [Streptomyces sp. TP-A0874]|uniref:elongation factor G n=1 Tax=Streptomyces sp. TP-A0874 TaxID=549819 RepID=UPI0008537EC4|nr:TetM/TetW/TetO/TetS family tetracycline resistance ribosomal protection protein [Streptomyces sp. TP-A0874]
MHIQRTLNIGILAHVDAGKTSLTERLLFDTGSIDRLGSVGAGDTRTDTSPTERDRGITVRSAVAPFVVGSTQVNLLDTPGHTDFLAEVERALAVLDGAVLVLSAVEGVQAHSRLLMRTLRGMGLPTLVFVNKIDRPGARQDDLLTDIQRKLAPDIIAMTAVRGLGTAAARTVPESLADPAFGSRLAEVLAENDEALLARLVDGPILTPEELHTALADHTAMGRVHPVYFGSALSGEGVGALVDGLTSLVPPAYSASDAGGREPRGIVFALERGPSGRKTHYLRLFSGELAPRQRVTFHRRRSDGAYDEQTATVTRLEVIGRPNEVKGPLTAGNIGRIKVADIRVGDQIGKPDALDDTGQPRLPTPTLQTRVRSRTDTPGAAARLHTALQSLAEQDPFIDVRVEQDGATSILLYGEIQKEILAAELREAFGLDAVFEPSRTICHERPVAVGEACEEMAYRAPGPSGFWATVGLRVEPAPQGAGVFFQYETELGALPPAFHRAVEEGVRAGLGCGPRGWAVTDCTVTLTRSGFVGPVSTAGDFRGLTPLVLARALEDAGTLVYEPSSVYEVEVPLDALPAITTALTGLDAEIHQTRGGDTCWSLTGRIPTRQVQAIERQLPGLTHGEGLWWSRPSGERPCARWTRIPPPKHPSA